MGTPWVLDWRCRRDVELVRHATEAFSRGDFEDRAKQDALEAVVCRSNDCVENVGVLAPPEEVNAPTRCRQPASP